MIHKKIAIRIVFKDGNEAYFKDVLGYQVREDQTFFIQTPPEVNEKKIAGKVTEVIGKVIGHWFPTHSIHEVICETTRVVNDPMDLKKREAFLTKNIDIATTDISATIPNKPNEVEEELERELRVPESKLEKIEKPTIIKGPLKKNSSKAVN